ncbi:MAG: hypothetical protein HW401_123 [Parcubacteria group bacterium]|nr:hypothetical protein [Parcubacteria group bacterium]
MFCNILDKKRLDILPLFKNFKRDFYLAGGTALALQIGHRDSIDFDFFGPENIDTKQLFAEISEIFKNRKILKTQEEKNTLTVFIDNDIKLSFFGYKYKLLNNTIEDDNLRLASIEDIACMKLSAITSRASNKDYIDLYYILQEKKLKDLLEKASEKFSDLDASLILKSLVYFADIENEPIIFKNNNFVDMEKVEQFLKEKVKEVMS